MCQFVYLLLIQDSQQLKLQHYINKWQLNFLFDIILSFISFLTFTQMTQKPGTPGSMPSKSLIFSWLKQIVPETSPKMKVQDLGDGVTYCKVINHYFPGSINMNRLNTNPKNQYDYSLNLKMFQNALTVHKINVPFDVGKIAKQKFLENWGLVNALYRQLSSNNNDESVIADDSKSVSYAGSKFTPKRSFEMAFSQEQHHKLSETQTYAKPSYHQSPRQPTIHYQSNQLYTTPPAPITQSNVQSSQNISLPQPQSQPQTSNTMMNQNTNHIASHMNQNIYNHGQISPSAFGGFNFGMTNNLNAINFNANQSYSFNRQQTPVTREPLNSMINKANNFDQPIISSKSWSVGKIPTRETLLSYSNQSQENSGKYSVNSHIFQNNYNAVIDRVKQILLKNSHDIEKIRQIKILLNIPLNEDIVKIEQEENMMINYTSIKKPSQELSTNENKTKAIEPRTSTKETVEVTNNVLSIENKENKEVQSCSVKSNQSSKSLSNTGSNTGNETKCEKTPANLKAHQNSGKKIKNNFFGEGLVFRK